MKAKIIQTALTAAAMAVLAACSLVEYRPVQTISRVDLNSGYRFDKALNGGGDDTLLILTFSGGGTRAAALGYGVLETLAAEQVGGGSMLDSVDGVFGVSGGSVLAVYFGLHGRETIPAFEKSFLKQNFQKNAMTQMFSLANLPRLTSRQFGRSDLMEEMFEAALFGKKTFRDLAQNRKGPFAVISATDMASGNRVDFTQETFDTLCLDLNNVRLARAVAASSAVPIVLSPVTLNNNGGRCGYTLPENLAAAVGRGEAALSGQTAREMMQELTDLADGGKRPYLHLLDGGLTDNLGLRKILELAAVNGHERQTKPVPGHIRRVAVISVNAQNRLTSPIDQSADVPSLGDMINSVVNVPIDQNTKESVRRFRELADQWNAAPPRNAAGETVGMHFVSLNLSDLPDTPLRTRVLNIPTSFNLPDDDVDQLKQAARVLLQQSTEYRRLKTEWRAGMR